MNQEELSRLKKGEQPLAKIAKHEAQLENAKRCNHVQITTTGFGEKGALPADKHARINFDIPTYNNGNGEEKHLYHEEAKLFIQGFIDKLTKQITELKKQFDEL